MAVAKDEKVAGETRRKAVFLVGSIGTPDALAFLAENIALKIPLGATEEDPGSGFMQTPCLYTIRSKGWAGGQAIMHSLKKTRSSRELMYLSSALQACLGERLARAAVDDALIQTRESVRTKNLTAIKTYLGGG